ncbi:MAG: hypothetical protein IKZ62_01650 [Prevotella sp.]|nr:hypothetical protein [Prevotella sp.]
MKINKLLTRFSWLKGFLVSLLGTSIGVGLTFTVNRCVDTRKQQAAQRETVIMAVCDIDEITQGLKEEMLMEDSLFKVAMYVSTHQELIDSLPMDTLDMAFEYLYDNPMKVKGWTADTKENAFNSGIDARMNIGNNQFYDNVQTCYYVRRSLIKRMEEAPVFRRPVSKEDYEKFLQSLNPLEIDQSGVPYPHAQRRVMKQIFAQESTTLYLKRFFSRRDAYLRATIDMERLNRDNKMLMNISDEDVEAYIERNSGNVLELASEELILGTWEIRQGQDLRTLVFKESNISELTVHLVGNFQIILQEEHRDVLVLTPLTYHLKGRWELRGDTLITDYDPKTLKMLSFDLDASNFPKTALERLKDSLEIKKEMAKNFITEQLKHQDFKDVSLISFDQYGNTIKMKQKQQTPAGKKEVFTIQLYRKQE